MRRAVVSLLNTPAGMYPWYERFPECIGAGLAEHGIEHVVGYKDYLDHARATTRLRVRDDGDMTSGDWLRRHLEPVLARYERVIVHTHSYAFGPSRIWELTRGHPGRRWWATSHRTPRPSNRLHAIPRRLLQRLRRVYPDRVFGCSETCTATLRTMFRPDSVAALVNGRLEGDDLTRFPPRGQPRNALFVGRLVREKGVWPLLEAGAELAARHADFRLVIVGAGPEEDAMRAWIAARGLSPRLRMAGYQADVAPFYAAADFVIVPTDPAQVAEGLCLVAIEAKAHALPVLYSLSGGLPETQLAGHTGLPLDPPDARHIAVAADSLMGDPRRYHAMRKAVADERRRWSLDAMVQRYVEAYVAGFDAF